jgi:hypothetical protein
MAQAVARDTVSVKDYDKTSTFILTAATTGTDFVYAQIWGGKVGGGADCTATPIATIGGQTWTILTYAGGLTWTGKPRAGQIVSGAKFGPAGGITQALRMDIDNGVAAPNNTSAMAAGRWTATQSLISPPIGPLPALYHRDVDLEGWAQTTVGPGAAAPGATAIGIAKDPWIFTPSQSTEIGVEVDLSNVWLEVDPDSPSQTGDAAVIVTTAFGTGSVPGQNIIAQNSYELGITSGTFSAGSLSLLGQTFSLAAGTTYWETADVTSQADMSGSSGPSYQPVGIEDTNTTLTSSGSSAGYGQPLTLTATVSGTGTPTGTVSFYDGSTFLGTGTLDSTGHATLVTSALGVGSHSLSAAYGGDTNFAASTSSALAETITTGTTTTSVLSSNSPSVYDEPVTFNAVVSTTTGTPTGTVSFYDGGTLLGTASVDESGIASFTTSTLAAGDHTITAVYSGDGNFAGSTSGSLTQTVNPDDANLALSSSQSSAPSGTAITITATVSGNGGTQPTGGTVSFYVDGVLVGTVNLSASGTASITLNGLSVGTHQITACYSSDGYLADAFSDPFQQTVTP